MKKARAMYIPAGGKKAVWGPIDQNVLPEGYPYKEQSETVVLAEETVTPTQIGTSASYMGNLSVAPALEAGKEYIVHLNGVKYVSTAFETSPAEGVTIIMLTDTGTQSPNKWGVQVMGEQAGVMTTSPEPYTFSITEQSETIHPMAPEFLPAGVGGGGLVVKVDENLVANTSNFEIAEAVAAGKQVVLIDDSDGQNSYLIPLVLSSGGMAIFSAALSLMGNLAMVTYTMTYPSTKMERTISNLATATT